MPFETETTYDDGGTAVADVPRAVTGGSGTGIIVSKDQLAPVNPSRPSSSDWLVFATVIAGLIFAGSAFIGGALHWLQWTGEFSGQLIGAVTGTVAGIALCSAEFCSRRKQH
jgi:hypothetical protein